MIWDGANWVSSEPRRWLVRNLSAIYVGSGGPRFRTTGYNCFVMRSAGGSTSQTMTATQRDAFMSSIRPGSLLRVWVFGAKANTYPDQTIFAEQDAIVADASKYGHRLIFVLADWSGQANDGTGPKNASWLTSDAYAGTYQTWLDKIVSRYAGEPTVAIWDLPERAAGGHSHQRPAEVR